jgi:hypothetical protein
MVLTCLYTVSISLFRLWQNSEWCNIGMERSNVRCYENPVSPDSDVRLTCEHNDRRADSEDTICNTFFFSDSCSDAKNERICHHVTTLRGLSRHVSKVRGLCHHVKAIRVLYLRTKKVKVLCRSVEPPCNDKVGWGMSLQILSVQLSKWAKGKMFCRVWCYSNHDQDVTKDKGQKVLVVNPRRGAWYIFFLNFVCECRDKHEKSNT